MSRALPKLTFYTHYIHFFTHFIHFLTNATFPLSNLLIFLMFLPQIQKVRNKHSNHKPNQNPFHFCFSFLLSSSILIHFQISNAPLTNPAVAKKYQTYKRKVFILIFLQEIFDSILKIDCKEIFISIF